MINLQKARMKLEKACENMSNKVDQQLKKQVYSHVAIAEVKAVFIQVYRLELLSSKFITYREI